MNVSVTCQQGTHKYLLETVGKGYYEVVGTLNAGAAISEMNSVYMGDTFGARARASHHTQRRLLHMYAGEFMSAALMAEQRVDPVLRDAAAHGFICICSLQIYVGIYVYIPTHPLVRSSAMPPHTGAILSPGSFSRTV